MNLPIRLLPEARIEFDRATDWYDDQRTGLGAQFVMRINEAFDRIASDPLRSAAIYHDIRKAAVMKYPYIILYRVEADEILIISVFHTSRDPSAWKSRA